MGRSRFTTAEIEDVRTLIREKQTADRSRQKTLRARMRAIGFYISDFAVDSTGFVVSDLDDLISRGVIAIDEDGPPDAPSLKPGRAAPPRPQRAGDRPAATSRPGAGDADVSTLVLDALAALTAASARPVAEATDTVPRRPGLYAIHAPLDVWVELGLGEPPDERPLYVGKAERSLASRDIDTHFGNGRTGSSTVRRTFAALLREALELDARPRNPAMPERPANYGLAPEHDERLSLWMGQRLELTIWPKPSGSDVTLGVIETAILQEFLPPLNIRDVVTIWTTQVKTARKVMADQARRWL